MIIPSLLDTFLPLLAKKNKLTAAIDTKNISITLKPTIATSPSKDIGKPKTIHILNMLVPIMLPIAISCSFFLAAIAVITNSGSDVPITITTIVISFWLTPIFPAIAIALSTNKSLLIIITAILKRKYVKYKETRTKDMDSENIIKRY